MHGYSVPSVTGPNWLPKAVCGFVFRHGRPKPHLAVGRDHFPSHNEKIVIQGHPATGYTERQLDTMFIIAMGPTVSERFEPFRTRKISKFIRYGLRIVLDRVLNGLDALVCLPATLQNGLLRKTDKRQRRVGVFCEQNQRVTTLGLFYSTSRCAGREDFPNPALRVPSSVRSSWMLLFALAIIWSVSER